ncbi:AAA domain-containing protein [Suillus subalutaceus]|uniref:AAA domain-containing protein n=1 Tax=Suillus subalutaceus TaxID=48586 RepID=UPI001B87F288|nr:AAA domain-containing protein [Suillus subalutaceus]KAG1861195.1 AAA domain-containing protein [Suillus subalutaceus]
MDMASEADLKAFIGRHRELLSKERDAEIERSALLLTNCGPKLLEQKGLALGSLGVVGINIGLGGKTLVELERPTAFHTSQSFPPHNFRPGDLARIEENVSSNAAAKKSAKSKKVASAGAESSHTAEGVVYKVSDTRIVIAVDPSDSRSDDLDLPERCRVLKLANSVTYDRMDKALGQLEKISIPSSRQATKPYSSASSDKGDYELTPLIRVLLGISPPSEKIPIAELKFFDDSLNPSQQKAVKFVLESREVACIHGPPGTGKTHTLIEIIRQLTSPSEHSANEKQQRILVCGASNLSVDNILERLLAIPPPEKGKRTPLTTTRIGHPARVMANQGVLEATLEVKANKSDQAALAKDVKSEIESTLDVLAGKGKGSKKPRGSERKKMWEEVKALRKEYRQREGGVVKTVLGESQVVLATCHSAGSRQLRDHKFDVVIIDEATQALEAVCWIPVFKARKLILAGDPMQLPPTILSIDKHKKKTSETATPKKSASTANDQKKSQESTASKPQLPEEDEGTSSSDADSEAESVKGDKIMAQDATIEVSEGGSQSNPKPEKKTQKEAKGRTGLRPPRTLETTLFDRLERMYGPDIKRLLNVQYRMHSQICQFPSKTLYASKLVSHQSVRSHLLKDLPSTSAFTSSEDEDTIKEILGTPVVFYDTAGCEYFERVDGGSDEGSRCNENEAAVVSKWVERLVGAGLLPSQIALITPYQAQVTLLTSLLRPVYGLELEIGTVDGMQGREKDAVIISLVRSNDKREVGFLKEKRRMNVAMTRAKRHLCIVGDSSTVKHGSPYLKKWLAWLEANADVRFAEFDSI